MASITVCLYLVYCHSHRSGFTRWLCTHQSRALAVEVPAALAEATAPQVPCGCGLRAFWAYYQLPDPPGTPPRDILCLATDICGVTTHRLIKEQLWDYIAPVAIPVLQQMWVSLAREVRLDTPPAPRV